MDKNCIDAKRFIFTGTPSSGKTSVIQELDHFDDLFTGNPIDIERNLSELLPEAEKRADKSVYL